MMFLNMYVHVLEAVVALLVVATAVQLFRCYRSFYQTTQTPSVAPPVISNLPNEIEKNYSSTGNILHDYIGEFFIDEAKAVNLDEYKNAEVINVKSVGTTKLTTAIIKETKEKEGNLANNIERSNVLSFEERADVSPDTTFSEDDDDLVITVMSSSTALSGVVDDKVMSDKVVHAMLDEAKLVCAS